MTGSMGGRRDESVKFSLKELMQLEDERIAEQNKLEAEETAKKIRLEEEAAKKALEEIEAKRRAEDEAAERLRKAELDEVARREGMQKALLEQTKLEVDVRARAEERERERRHELELAKVKADASSKSGIGVILGSGLVGVALTLAICAGAFFGSIKPSSDRRIAELEQNVATAENRANDLDHRTLEQQRTIGKLEADVQKANGELDVLKKSIKAAPPSTPPRQPIGGHAPTPPRNNPPPEAPCANKFDPLCGHIP